MMAIGLLATSAHAVDAKFIKASGCDLRDNAGNGSVVALRGVNLGGWLSLEQWMCPFTTNNSASNLGEVDVETKLINRFGVTTKNSLINTFQANWITTADLDAIAAAGMNMVRVPFSYLMFMEHQPGTVALNQVVWKSDATAFYYLDWVVTQCAQRGIYVLIDFHTVEGVTGAGDPYQKDSQGNYVKDSAGNNILLPDTFWYTPAYLDRYVEIWRRIAARYAGNSTVIGYDLLNEPWGKPHDVYDRCYRTIRAVDPDHALFMELWSYPDVTWAKQNYAWQNVVCSLHFYPSDATFAGDLQNYLIAPLAAARTAPSGTTVCPLHVGEFTLSYANNQSQYTTAIKAFANNGMAWTKWAHKSTNVLGWTLINGLANAPAAISPNLDTDSAATIQTAWTGWKTASPAVMYQPSCDAIASPVAVNDSFTVPAAGCFTFRAADLLANDRDLSQLAQLEVTGMPSRSAHGTLTAVAGGYVYQVDNGFTGTDTFTYRTIDQHNHLVSTTAATVNLTVSTAISAPAPYTFPDTYTTNLNSPLRVTGTGVLANDGDLQGRNFYAQVVQGPSNGTLSLDTSGAFVYTPNSGFTGVDSFTYRCNSEGIVSAPTTVTITVTAPAPTNGGGLSGSYYSNTGFSGTPASRTDSTVNFTWDTTTGTGISNFPTQNYSVSWTGWITAPFSGTWNFSATIDDGMEVWINGTQIINSGGGSSGRTIPGSANLIGGQAVPILVKLINYGGGATARLAWSHALVPSQIVPATWLSTTTPVPPSARDVVILDQTGGLTGDYHTGTTLANRVLVRTDANLDLSWGYGAPGSGLPADNFSVRWNGWLTPRYTETYTLGAASDDGVRVWIDGNLVIDAWYDKGDNEIPGTVALQAGKSHAIKVEYYEHTGNTAMRLYWQSRSQSKEIIPSGAFTPAVPAALSIGKTYTITSLFDGQAVDVSGYDGLNIIQWPLHSAANQQWRLDYAGDGWVKLVSKSSGKVLVVPGSLTQNGLQLQVAAASGATGEQWRIERTGNGVYRLISRASGMVMDLSGWSTTAGSKIAQWGDAGQANQRWVLEEIPTGLAQR